MSKVCLITGANAGIGRAAALGLAQRGQHVVLLCRDAERGREAQKALIASTTNQRIDLVVADLSDQAAVRRAAAEILERYPRIDVLIHNAGIFDPRIKHPEINADGVEQIFATNYLGPFLLTELLRERLAASQARILTIASKGLLALPRLKLDFADFNQLDRKKFSAMRAYYQSKLALLTWTADLAQELKKSGATVNAVRVPAVQLDAARLASYNWLLRRLHRLKTRGALKPSEMAATYVALALADTYRGVTGKYIAETLEPVALPAFARSKANQQRLRELSTTLTGAPAPLLTVAAASH